MSLADMAAETMTQLDFEGPVIVKMHPALGGRDNAGVGETQFGERFVLKLDPKTCVAEFVGATICEQAGVPTCRPSVVQFNGRPVFGSRLEAGTLRVPEQIHELSDLLKNCDNPSTFSAVFAIDLALGNPDRHWSNWLYQERTTGGSIVLRTIDFSRSWPRWHPPLGISAMQNENTFTAWAIWDQVGIAFDAESALSVCGHLERLDENWLANLMDRLPTDWKASCDADVLFSWWRVGWTERVKETRDFLQAEAWQ